MNNAYIVNGVRTAIGTFTGTLASVRADDLAASVLNELLKRNPALNPNKIEDIILGCANQAGEDNRNVARMSALLAGIPFSVPAETVNRLCASGLSASIAAARAIQCGDADITICGGVENMTRGPWVIGKANSAYGRDQQMYDSSFGWRFINPVMKQMYGTEAMGETAENLPEKCKISREDQDSFAFKSQIKAANANNNGRFAKEIVSINIPQRKGEPKIFNKDEFIKPETTLNILSALKPAFKKE